jgi:hypothetical protein
MYCHRRDPRLEDTECDNEKSRGQGYHTHQGAVRDEYGVAGKNKTKQNKTLRNLCPSDTSPSTNLASNDPDLNMGIRSEKPPFNGTIYS